MNKKIFTLLTAAMLMSGSLVNVSYAAVGDISVVSYASSTMKLANGTQFYLQSAAASQGTAATYYPVSAITVEKKDYVTLGTAVAADEDWSNVAAFEVRNLSVSSTGVTFELWSGNKQLFVGADGKVVSATDKTKLADLVGAFSAKYDAAKDKGKINFKGLYTATTPSAVVSENAQAVSISKEVDETMFTEYNKTSTTLSFDATDLEGNPFSGVVPVSITTGEEPTTSTYFVKGKAEDITAFKKTQSAENAKKLSIAVVKNAKYVINALQTGEGYKIVLMGGADFADEDAFDENLANAAFTKITEVDQLNKPGVIKLEKKIKFADPKLDEQDITVCAVKASSTDTKTYVTTILSSGSKFTAINPMLGENSYLPASTLLKDGVRNIVNIYFTSSTKSQEDATQTEYHKYLTVNAGTGNSLQVLALDDVDFTSPLSQWVVADFDGKYKFTLKNRETGAALILKLQNGGKEGGYKVESVSGSAYDNIPANAGVSAKVNLAGTSVKFNTISTTATDGFLSFTKEQMTDGIKLALSGKTALAGEKTFYIVGENNKVSQKESEAFTFIPERVKDADDVENYIINATDYAYLKDGKKVVVTEGDTLIVPSYILKVADKKYLGFVNSAIITNADNKGAMEFAFKKSANGGYYMIEMARKTTVATGDVVYSEVISSTASVSYPFGVLSSAEGYFLSGYVPSTGIYSTSVEIDSKFANVEVISNDATDRVTLPAKSRHASFDNILGSITMKLNKSINEGIQGESMIFWLDTVGKANTPSFYISRGVEGNAERMFMFNPADSLKQFTEGSAQESYNANYQLEGTGDKSGIAKVVFRPATLIAKDTLATTIDGKLVSVVTKDASAAKSQVNGLDAYQFGICLADPDVEGEYIIYSKKGDKDHKYVYALNGKLGFGSEAQALVVTLGEGAATSNDAVTAETIKVVAGEGQVTIAGAAGKKVVISNILGQVVANTVIASDNATIAAPAGIVVVAVEGEAAVKAIVK